MVNLPMGLLNSLLSNLSFSSILSKYFEVSIFDCERWKPKNNNPAIIVHATTTKILVLLDDTIVNNTSIEYVD